MITTTIEIVLIAMMTIITVIGLTVLWLSLETRRLNPPPAGKNHDHKLCVVEPQQIHQLFDYKK